MHKHTTSMQCTFLWVKSLPESISCLCQAIRKVYKGGSSCVIHPVGTNRAEHMPCHCRMMCTLTWLLLSVHLGWSPVLATASPPPLFQPLSEFQLHRTRGICRCRTDCFKQQVSLENSTVASGTHPSAPDACFGQSVRGRLLLFSDTRVLSIDEKLCALLAGMPPPLDSV